MKKLILLVVMCFAFPAFGQSKVKIPTLKVCVSASGVVAVKQKCARTETTANFGILKGNQGANGNNGTLDPNKCFKRESQASGSGNVLATTNCLVSEFIVSSSCVTNTANSYQIASRLQGGQEGGGLLGDQVYQSFQCYMGNFTGESYTVTAQALCCRP